jgi:uncharacterized protein DUF6527
MHLKAEIVDDIRGDGGQAPGAIEFRFFEREPEQMAGIACRCPCGCGYEMWLPVHRQGEKPRFGVSWEWNGDQAAPVLSPSVFNTGLPCQWHGYLGRKEAGYWDQC